MRTAFQRKRGASMSVIDLHRDSFFLRLSVLFLPLLAFTPLFPLLFTEVSGIIHIPLALCLHRGPSRVSTIRFTFAFLIFYTLVFPSVL
ncbi:hypothetical protein CC2G_004842 [Coprinopsis cinerea AmutBmut pab1-1]|nr:hypothetical protein CC2G_004842 [Coprinopsis cinerea AmutBmut pab1-1]